MKHFFRTISLVILTALLFSACTTIPEQLKGEYTPLIPDTATEKNLGTPVRWGGVLLETRPENDYHFPVVDIEFMSLWPERRESRYYDYYGPYRPYYWHYPHYGLYYRYPY